MIYVSLVVALLAQEPRIEDYKGTIDRAFEKLKSEDAAERDKATDFLKALSTHLQDGLIRTAKSKDKEVALRARRINDDQYQMLLAAMAEISTMEKRILRFRIKERDLKNELATLKASAEPLRAEMNRYRLVAVKYWVDRWTHSYGDDRTGTMTQLLETGRAAYLIVRDSAPPELVKELHRALEQRRDEQVRKQLKGQQMALDLKPLKLADFARELCAYTGLNFFVATDVGDLMLREGLKSEGVTIQSLLDRTLEPHGLETRICGGVVLIARGPGDLPGPTTDRFHERDRPKFHTTARILLDRAIDVNFDALSLMDCVRVAASRTEVKINLDAALAERTILSLRLKDVPAHVLIRLLCLDTGADWTIDDEGVVQIKQKDKN